MSDLTREDHLAKLGKWIHGNHAEGQLVAMVSSPQALDKAADDLHGRFATLPRFTSLVDEVVDTAVTSIGDRIAAVREALVKIGRDHFHLNIPPLTDEVAMERFVRQDEREEVAA